jgi:hypothetical protein
LFINTFFRLPFLMSNPFLAGMDLTPMAAPNLFGSVRSSGGGGETLGGLGGEELNDALRGMDTSDVGGGFGEYAGGTSSSDIGGIGSRDLGNVLALVEQDDEPEEHVLLAFLEDPPGTKICCGVISSGQGVKRFCLQPVIEGTDGCGTGTHRLKAAVAALAWYITVRIRGNVRAGLVDKYLMREDILMEDRLIFDQESHAPGPWMSRFQVARMAKLGTGDSLRTQADAGIPPEVGLHAYAKTPAKRRRLGEVGEADESPSWVDVGLKGASFQDIQTWGPLADRGEINQKAQANFVLLRQETVRATGNWSDALVQIRESITQLMSAQSQTEIRVGTPGAFGASVGVVNAFNGLRHLMELLGDAETKFNAMPRANLIKLVQSLDQRVVAMTASDPWATETSALRKMIGETTTNLTALQDKSVGLLVAMYHYYTERGHTIPGNRLQEAIDKLQREVDEVKATSASPAPTQSQAFGMPGGHQQGFGFEVSSGTGGNGLAFLEARMMAAVQKNQKSEAEVLVLKQAGSGGGCSAISDIWKCQRRRSIRCWSRSNWWRPTSRLL